MLSQSKREGLMINFIRMLYHAERTNQHTGNLALAIDHFLAIINERLVTEHGDINGPICAYKNSSTIENLGSAIVAIEKMYDNLPKCTYRSEGSHGYVFYDKSGERIDPFDLAIFINDNGYE